MNHLSSNRWTEAPRSAVAAVASAEAGRTREEPRSAEPPVADHQALVLIATQRLQVRAVGTTVLRTAGFRVEAATSGKAVLADIEKLQPDLLLTEASLDDMNAVRLCSQVRGLTAGREIPILVISDLSDAQEIQKILSEELTDVIETPVNWKVLTFRIHRWISMATRFRSLGDHDLDFEEVRESALRASTELLQLRNYDSLTGLANREMFVSSLELVLAQGQRSAGYSAVLYLDIDDFKEVNDLIGRSLGDELLRIVARRLQGCLREDDLVSQMGEEGSLASFARMNADQFAILLASVPDKESIAAVGRRLSESLARPLKIGDREFRLTAKIGIADSLNLDDEGEEVLLQRAEVAMRYCKQREGKTSAVFESFMNDLVVEKLELKAELRKALEREELFLCYQLLVDARTATPTGVEGLIRWNHPARGLVPPYEFLPVAEESDLMVEIDRWVLRAGCRQGKEWLDKGFPPLLMSLNVSMRFLGEEDFAQQVLAIVEQTGFPPSSLQLELSERGNLPDAGRIMAQFDMLVAEGIHLALDDFGTGQTSLSYLRTLPISCVKVDQSFVRRVPDDSASAAIVTAIEAMSHHLGLKVVAEGVETADHWRFLAENGYDQLQGFLFSKPERVEELETGFRNLVDWQKMIGKRETRVASARPRAARAAAVRKAGGKPRPRPVAPSVAEPVAHVEPVEPAGAEGWQGTEAHLLQLARNDFLTKLYNRFSFDERLEHAVAHADRFGHKVALLLLDLDDFKYVNDTYGHAVGDALLVAIAGRLKKLVRKIDTLARIGGDEFAVILSEFTDVKHVAELGGRLLQVLARPMNVEGRELRVTGSLGISVYPAGSTQAKDLLRQADLALYKGKKHGGNGMRFFSREMDWEVQRRLALARDLEGAVERGELFIEYQLQVALETGEVVGVEALLRWDHPAKGLIGPGRLIPIAESTGEIRSIGRWVIRSACAQAKEWQLTCGLDVPVSVNLSPVQCRDSRFAASVVEALKEHELAPHLLHLELNERLLAQLPAQLEESLQQLGDLGVSLTLDNFGSGTSALEHFQRFRFQHMKIHQSLVRTVGDRSASSSVLSGIVALAHKMDVQIVAEGVEHAEEVQALLAEGCDVGQGYLFSRPVPPDALPELMDGDGVLRGYRHAKLSGSSADAGPRAPEEAPPAAESAGAERGDADGGDDHGLRLVWDAGRGPVQDEPRPPSAEPPAREDPAPDLAERLASLGSVAAGVPAAGSSAESATVELRKLDSHTATAVAPGGPWKKRLRVGAALATLAILAGYFQPWEAVRSSSGAFGAAEPAARASVPPPATAQPAAVQPAAVVVPPAAAVAPTVVEAGPPPEPAAAETFPDDQPAAGDRDATGPVAVDSESLTRLAESWAQAWSEQRATDYLGFYSRDFRPPDGLDRSAWEKQRQTRILRPRQIEVRLSGVEVEAVSPERARVSFDQGYRSDSYRDSVRKTLELIREGEAWKILAERVDG